MTRARLINLRGLLSARETRWSRFKRSVNAPVAVALIAMLVAPAASGRQGPPGPPKGQETNATTAVCHYADDSNTYFTIWTSKKGASKHLRAGHGDGLPGDPVPGMEGFEFSNDCVPVPIDTDGDGFPVFEDCDDNDPTINPGAFDVPGDNIDQNCNGFDAVVYYVDRDVDGFGDPDDWVIDDTGSQPAGYVSDSTDCDDFNANVNPGAVEVLDGIDNDCDGEIDEGLVVEETIFAIAYTDADPNDGPGFKEGDVLIAKLVDASLDGQPGAGDRIVMGQFPFVPWTTPSSGFASLGVSEHVGMTDCFLATGWTCNFPNGLQIRFLSEDSIFGEGYIENDNSLGTVGQIVDGLDGADIDYVWQSGVAASQPVNWVQGYFAVNDAAPLDDPFIDVDIHTPVP